MKKKFNRTASWWRSTRPPARVPSSETCPQRSSCEISTATQPFSDIPPRSTGDCDRCLGRRHGARTGRGVARAKTARNPRKQLRVVEGSPVRDFHPLERQLCLAGHWDSLTVNAAATASSTAKSWAGMPPDCVVLHSWEKGAPRSLPDDGQASPAEQASSGLKSQLDKPRGHLWRFWMAQETDRQPWIQLDLGKPRDFDRIYMREKFNRIRSFKIQIEVKDAWKTVFQGAELDVLAVALPERLTAQKVRLLVTEYLKEGEGVLRGPGIQEFDIYLSNR
jgi:hypothetical protein